MGQYYRPVSIEKQQSIYSHDYDNGLKLMEHSWIGNNFMQAVEGLIKRGGKWHGTRIVWAGDYADNEPTKPGEDEQNLYSLFHENSIKPPVEKRRKTQAPLRFLKNLDTGEFVDLNKVPVTDTSTWTDDDGKTHSFDFRIHPLSLMTCEGNGRGGGDFHHGGRGSGNGELIGKWARNRVVIQTKRPKCKNAKEIIFDLKENW
jgi:hypothetical protein